MNKKLLSLSVASVLALMSAAPVRAEFVNSADLKLSTNVATPEHTFYLTVPKANKVESGVFKNFFVNANAGITNGTELGARFALFAGDEEGAYYLYSIAAQKWLSPVNATSPSAGQNKVQLVASKEEAKPWFIKKEEGNAANYDLYPSRAELEKGASGLAWNFFGGVTNQGTNTVGLYQANDNQSSFGIYYGPEAGKKYSVRIANESGGNNFSQYLYNNNGTLTVSNTFEKADKFMFEPVVNADGTFSFRNLVGKYLAHKALNDAAYKFNVLFQGFTTNAVSLWSKDAGKYFVVKDNGQFDQATRQYNPYTEAFSTDFIFEEITDDMNFVSLIVPNEAQTEVTVNQQRYSANASLQLKAGQRPVISAVSKHPDYEIAGFKHNDHFVAASEWAAYTAAFASGDRIEVVLRPTYFSDSFEQAKWLRIVSSNETNGYSWNAATPDQPKALQSNTQSEDELFAFVGTNEGFKIYAKSRGAGVSLAAKETPNNGVGTGFTAEGSEWVIIPAPAGKKEGIQIAVKGNNGFVVNKYGGSGELPLKFYYANDNGGIWKVMTLAAVNVRTEMDAASSTVPAPTARFTVNGVNIPIQLTAGQNATEVHYLPRKGAVLQLTNEWRGYTLSAELNGTAKHSGDSLNFADNSALLSVAAKLDPANKHQYLFYRDNTASYRIPAITTTNDGRVVVATDHRIDHADIGWNARVNIKVRRGAEAGLGWNGATWEAPIMAAQGTGVRADADVNAWNYAFGDPALVADRDSSHVLLISVGGSMNFWEATVAKPQHVVRHLSKDNGQTWTATPLTEQFYSATEDPTKVLLGKAGGAFYGSGRIVQSKVFKKDNYYRLYACLLGQKDKSRTGNFVTYSDDFGATWHPLGIANLNAMDGDEPKVEELPDGTVMLSARRGGSRVFNLFKFDETNPNAMAEGKGSWGNALHSNSNGTDGRLAFGSNATNGEVMVVRGVKKADGTQTDLLLQSIPFADGRANVGFFFKELNKPGKQMSVVDLCSGWTRGLQVSDRNSAYSTMTMLPDGRIGFFYEEDPTGYAMVYVPLSISEITKGAYSSGFEPFKVEFEGGEANQLGVSYLGAHFAGVANAKNGGTLYLSKQPTAADFKLTGLAADQLQSINFDVDGNTIRVRYTLTGLQSATTSSLASSATYDLAGRKVVAPQKSGLYIQNGKRFFVK